MIGAGQHAGGVKSLAQFFAAHGALSRKKLPADDAPLDRLLPPIGWPSAGGVASPILGRLAAVVAEVTAALAPVDLVKGAPSPAVALLAVAVRTCPSDQISQTIAEFSPASRLEETL
jgi:hypothetical protein